MSRENRHSLVVQQPLSDGADGDLPVFQRLRDALAEQIRSGEFAVGAKLPSERDLAERSGIARMTARKALGLLEAEGLVHRSGRRGYFVSPPRVQYDPSNHVNVMKLVREQGFTAENLYLGRQLVEAPQSLAELFQKPAGTLLVLEKSVVVINGRRALYEEDFLLEEAIPGYADEPYVSPFTQNLQQNYGVFPKQTWLRLRVTNISHVAAEHLGVSVDTVGFSFLRVKEHNGQVVEVDRDYWLSDSMELVIGKSDGT